MQGRSLSDHVSSHELSRGLGHNLIIETTSDWGAYVDRLEDGWLKTSEAQDDADDSFIGWATQTHAAAQIVWKQLPDDHVLDDNYYRSIRPILDSNWAWPEFA